MICKWHHHKCNTTQYRPTGHGPAALPYNTVPADRPWSSSTDLQHSTGRPATAKQHWLTFSWWKRVNIFISRNVRWQYVWCSKGLIFFIATLPVLLLSWAELHYSAQTYTSKPTPFSPASRHTHTHTHTHAHELTASNTHTHTHTHTVTHMHMNSLPQTHTHTHRARLCSAASWAEDLCTQKLCRLTIPCHKLLLRCMIVHSSVDRHRMPGRGQSLVEASLARPWQSLHWTYIHSASQCMQCTYVYIRYPSRDHFYRTATDHSVQSQNSLVPMAQPLSPVMVTFQAYNFVWWNNIYH